MAPPPSGPFDTSVARALDLLGVSGSSPAIDALVDPRGAAEALASLSAPSSPLLVRVASELGPSADGFAPPPVDPLWILLTPGSSEIRAAPLRLDDQAAAPSLRARRAARVAIEMSTGRCCAAPSCELVRTTASVWIELDPAAEQGLPRRLLAAEVRDLDARKAVDTAGGLGALFARALGVPLEVEGSPADPAEREIAASPHLTRDKLSEAPPRLPASALARFSLRGEGDRIVIRDLAGAGPRQGARRTILIGVVLLVIAAALWAQAIHISSEGVWGAPLAFGAVAALVTLTGYAFLGVGRFAARYGARSSPILAFGLDRMIVAPWVGRDGAIDLRPEGRLGAAIPIGEVRAANVRLDGGQAVVELETDHGPFDGLIVESRDVAEVLCEAIRASIEGVAHPSSGESARARARAKAKAKA